ncbi:MAG: cyclase family protein [Candidatus Poribacteria bacterium]|nr:cyclase family protein [Candidatus Poribacteria bacterium]
MAQLVFERMVDLSYEVNAESPREMPIGPPKLYHTATMEKDGYFESRIDLSGHCSTHIDTPSLMYKDGFTTEGIDLSKLTGDATVVDVTDLKTGDVINAAVLQKWEDGGGSFPQHAIVFFKTGMEALFGEKVYNHNWIGLDGTAAQWLVDRGIKLVGTDACAIESVHGPRDGFPAHHTFLENGIPIVENLRNLNELPDTFLVVVAPMKLTNSSGSPTRVYGFV